MTTIFALTGRLRFRERVFLQDRSLGARTDGNRYVCDEPEQRYIINQTALRELYPTHVHEAEFWEALGRTVATFGFLEETLGKAIFSFTATKPYRQEEIARAYAEWLPKLERALTDQLRV